MSADTQSLFPLIHHLSTSEAYIQTKQKKNNNIYFSLHKNIELLDSPISGKGLFARETIKEGEVVWRDPNYVDCKHWVTIEQLNDWPKPRRDWFLNYAYQVSDDVWTGPLDMDEVDQDASVFHNHSCDPNTWFDNDFCMTARRDIQKGEELTYDYATSDVLFSDFECRCRSAHCRGIVGGEDYKLLPIQHKYGNHFLSYINNKIVAQQRQK